MQIFLLWHSKKDLSNDFKNSRIKKIKDETTSRYQQHILDKLNTYSSSLGKTSLIYLTEKSLDGGSSYFHATRDKIAFSTGTPTGLNDVLPVKNGDSNLLSDLKGQFEINGLDLIKKISPPYVFCFIDPHSCRVIHDGLGLEQVFKYEDEDVWVCSNRCWPIRRFFMNDFSADDNAWKHYFEVGNFPMELTPFKKITMLDRGEVCTCRDGRIVTERVDCFHDWFHPLKMKEDELLEFARVNFNNAVKELAQRYGGKTLRVDLSGGRDTRMILSSLIKQKIPCGFTTVGEHYSADVKVVKMLEKAYPIDVNFKNPTLESLDKDIVLRKIDSLINWKDGVGEFKSAKYMNIEPVNIAKNPLLSGNLGGLYRAFYPRDRFRFIPLKNVKKIIKKMIGRAPQMVKSSWKTTNVKKRVFKEGRKYGFSGYYLMDYYNIIEKTRRWGSAVIAMPYNGYMLPFVNIGLLKVNFSIPMKDKADTKLHTHVIKTNVPGLEKLPYDTDLMKRDKSLSKTPYNEDFFWRGPNGKIIMENILNKDHYLWNNILKKTVVNKMWGNFCQGRGRYGSFFWRVAGFHHWYATFNS